MPEVSWAFPVHQSFVWANYFPELHRQISLFNIFPPILVARAAGTLIGHAYVESFSVSGLALIGPISLVPENIKLPDVWEAKHSVSRKEPKSFTVPIFSYEPRFPILHLEVLDRKQSEEAEKLSSKHFSSWPDGNIDLKGVDGTLHNEKGVTNELKSWLNDVGL